MFTALVPVCILVASYLVYDQASTLILAHSKTSVDHNAQLARQSFYNLLNEVSNDIAVLTNNPSVQSYMKEPSKFNAQQVGMLARVVLENKPEYYQLRILGAHDGKEKLRFNKGVQQEIYETLPEHLQDKRGKEYFINTIGNTNSDYYFSEINLNEEFGMVSEPHIPTLRALGKIRNSSNEAVALLVINVDLTYFYQRLEQIIESGSKFVITNSSGIYLYDEDPSKRFSNQLGSKSELTNDFDIEWPPVDGLDSSTFSVVDKNNIKYVCQLDQLSYSSGHHIIYLFTMLDLDKLLAEARAVRNNSFKITIAISLLALLFIFLFTRVLSKSINLVTRAVVGFEKNIGKRIESTIPENRKDEVGLLARSFSKMKTRLEEQMNALKEGYKREQRAIKSKDEFLQNMSHELRTPLNAINGLTELLNKNKKTEEQKPIIEALKRSTSTLSGLMYDILDHQKMIEGKVSIKYAPSDISEILKDIHASYQFDAVLKNLDFKIELDEKLSQNQYQTDGLRLTQIVTNLIVNAIKFTNAGEVCLSAKIMDEDKLEICVSDTGIGIQPENLEKIKDRFYRENASISQTEGFGLGLSIVKHLIELFDGAFQMQSKIGEGSKFIVILPVTISDHINDARIRGHRNWPKLIGKYKIIHLEDDKSALLLIKNILKSNAMEVEQSTDFGHFKKLIEQDCNLVICDLMIGSHSLKEEIPELLSSKNNLAAIYISAFEPSEVSDLVRFYLQKPFKIDDLLILVYSILGVNEYEEPTMSRVYEQYDSDRSKISNYLNILIEEFSNYEIQIIN